MNNNNHLTNFLRWKEFNVNFDYFLLIFRRYFVIRMIIIPSVELKINQVLPIAETYYINNLSLCSYLTKFTVFPPSTNQF